MLETQGVQSTNSPEREAVLGREDRGGSLTRGQAHQFVDCFGGIVGCAQVGDDRGTISYCSIGCRTSHDSLEACPPFDD